jgi:hypothetical protein
VAPEQQSLVLILTPMGMKGEREKCSAPLERLGVDDSSYEASHRRSLTVIFSDVSTS